MLRLIGLFDIPYTVKYIDRFCTIHDIGVCKYTSGRYVLCKYGNYYSSNVFSKRVMSCLTALLVRSNTFGRVEYIDHNPKITNDAYNTMINIFLPPPPPPNGLFRTPLPNSMLYTPFREIRAFFCSKRPADFRVKTAANYQ